MKSGFLRFFYFSLFLVAVFAAPTPELASAQTYHTQTYQCQDGVPSNVVFNSAQDSLGNMWFTTRLGLAVFNGITWESKYEYDPEGPIRDGLISIDSKGVFWWASLKSPLRICRLQDDKWKVMPSIGLVDEPWNTVGLQSFVNAQGISTLVVASRSGIIKMWTGESWITLPSGTKERKLFSLEITQSNLLISTDKGLFKSDLNFPQELPTLVTELPPGPVFATAADAASSTTWAISNSWLARIVNGKIDKVFAKQNSGEPIVNSQYSACLGPNGGLYYVDYRLAFYFHPLWGYEQFTSRGGLAADDGNSAMMDREKNVWITSGRGISKISSRRMACYDHNQGLLGDEISAILQRSTGEIVLGHRHGLTFFGPEMKTLKFKQNHGIIKRVIDLNEDADGHLWIAAYRQGLGLLKDNGSIQWHGPDQGLALPVYSILNHPDQGIFTGTSKGLFHKNGPLFEKIPLPGVDNDSTPYIRRLVALSSGRFAIATGKFGVFIWQDGTISHYPGNDADGTNSTYTVLEHADGTIWVGTEQGLCTINNNRLEYLGTAGPKINQPIYAITEDLEGDYWFGTDEGVFIWNGVKQTHLTTKEGLLGNETNRDALLCDKGGHLWLGTESGLSVYRKEFEITNRATPVLTFTQLTINGKQYPTDQPIFVKGPLGSLTVTVQAPYFSTDNPIKFRVCRAENSNVEIPIQVAWPGVLYLTNIPPGKFQVQIQAKTYDGLETNIVTIPLITIAPPLAQRWYMRFLFIAAGIVVVWLAFAFFTGRKYAKNLEDEVKLQTRNLRSSEEKVRLESERLAGTMESISEGVVVLDGQGFVLLINPAAEAMFGCAQEQALGKTMERVLPVTSIIEPKQKKLYKQWLNHPKGVRFQGVQIPIHTHNQLVCWLESSAVPISGSPGGFVFVFRDITDRRNSDKEEQRTQKLESLGLMAGGIAHDFNNLLAIMLGNLSLAENTLVKNSEETRQLAKIRHASERAQQLTQQLLTFAKGGGPLREPTNMATMVRESVSFSLSGSNITCQLNLPDDLWWADVDASQISQVLGNLVINAYQSMPGGGSIRISAQNVLINEGSPKEEQWIEIRIQDFGSGISEDNLLQIFDPYFTTKETGTGLGLAIAHSVMKKHGGKLTVKSRKGAGSTFCMSLPAISIGSTGPRRFQPEVSKHTIDHKVLFMDDDEDIRDILSSMLGQLGHTCYGVADGEAAIAAFINAQKTNAPFSLIILDLTIPGKMGGKETIAKMRNIDTQVPIIVASGYSNDKILANFRHYGFTGILNKPFSTNDLKKVLDESI